MRVASIGAALVCAAIAVCQSQPGAWQSFKSAEGRFSVQLPASVQKLTQNVVSKAGDIRVHMFYAVEGMNVYMVTYNEIPVTGIDAKGRQFVLESALQGALRNKKNGKIVRAAPSKVEGHEALDALFEFDTPSGKRGSCLWRAVLANDRLYQALTLGERGNLDVAASRKLFGSLRIQ